MLSMFCGVSTNSQSVIISSVMSRLTKQKLIHKIRAKKIVFYYIKFFLNFFFQI